MNDAVYKERVKRLKEVDEVIKGLDPAIREAGFKLLQNYITGEKLHTESGGASNANDNSGNSEDAIFTKFNHDKPSDNVLLIAADHFRQYGSAPFSLEELRTTATANGLTIPNTPNMTLKAAVRQNKKLFATAGRGKFKPTSQGEQYFKETYNVTKGKNKKPEGTDE
jgi:hypothetical protein